MKTYFEGNNSAKFDPSISNILNCSVISIEVQIYDTDDYAPTPSLRKLTIEAKVRDKSLIVRGDIKAH